MAVVGAGPTGLTAAFYLALLGHEVTVYESQRRAGGMLRYALPEYRLPKAVLDREIELIRRLGVKFVFNTSVGTDITLNDLDTQLRRRLPLHRHLEGGLGLPARHGVEGRDAGAARSWKRWPRRSPCRWASRWW